MKKKTYVNVYFEHLFSKQNVYTVTTRDENVGLR